MRERGKAERFLSTPAPWWRFGDSPGRAQGMPQLIPGSAASTVPGFLLIAPPLLPEGCLSSLHTFKFQRGFKKKKKKTYQGLA